MTTTTTTAAPARPDPDRSPHAVPTPRRVTATSHTVGLRQTLSHTRTMAYRGLLKIKHNPEQLFDVVVQPIIFTLMFTYIFGGAISGAVDDYLPVVIPGILVQTVIVTSIVTGTQLREDMDKGVFDRFKSLPIARISPLSGALLADVVRYGVATVITFIVGLIMGYRPGGGALGVIAAGVLVIVCAWAISWIFAFMGVVMNKASTVQGVSMIVLFPLTFMSNAFVPVETMPGWLQGFVKINPVSHLVSAVRELANNGHVGMEVVWTLAAAAVVVAVMAPITVRAYMRKA
ncbi:ABC transporter permease [Tomitella fengzijianii]|uniref:Transport permease protein n=1 Tax=Tomitella fengzijianii TaxID=2597660 RepID=A0A516X0F7_9ACTN|nr:ABC transporter permease [Tomitella fengzijianii]QDQ96520.1 ABC transporter permease [Tomitella fengzijianii]